MYTSGQHEIPLTTGTATLDLTSTGDKARWSPGFKKARIRGIGIAINAAPGDAGVVKFDKRPTFGSDTNRGDGDVEIINLATTHAAGAIIYTRCNVQVNPGQEVVMEVTDASANVNAAKCSLLVEYDEEQPANISAMVETT